MGYHAPDLFEAIGEINPMVSEFISDKFISEIVDEVIGKTVEQVIAL